MSKNDFEDIRLFLDTKINPVLAEHGGSVKLISAADDTIEVSFAGRCAGCPAADYSTRQWIEDELKESFQNYRKVAITGSVSESLLNEARKLLRHE